MVAAYYMWRPLKGDPLSIGRVVVEGTDVRIDLELEEKPQGRGVAFPDGSVADSRPGQRESASRRCR